jgi:spore coat protein I
VKVRNTLGELIEIANNVLSKYDIIPENIKIIQNEGLKTLWKFTHNNEIMCLKRLRHSKDKATFSVNAQLYIYSSGGDVPKVYLNAQGEAITEYMGQLFVLYEWIDSRDLNFTRPSDFYLGLEALAKFHVVSKGYVPPEGARVSFKLGKWPEQYESMKNRMIKWKEQAKVNISKSSYSSYLKYIDYIIELCNMAINDINKSSYDALTSIKFEESSLCHQDYGTGNAILSHKGVYVIDLDGVTYDLPSRDLRKIIGKRAEKQGKWENNDIETIIQHYEKNNILSPQEKEILKIDLMFPHWFFGTVKNIFLKNKLVSPSKIARIAKLEESKLSVLNQWH